MTYYQHLQGPLPDRAQWHRTTITVIIEVTLYLPDLDFEKFYLGRDVLLWYSCSESGLWSRPWHHPSRLWGTCISKTVQHCSPDLVNALQQLTILHPADVTVWLQLADAYRCVLARTDMNRIQESTMLRCVATLLRSRLVPTYTFSILTYK